MSKRKDHRRQGRRRLWPVKIHVVPCDSGHWFWSCICGSISSAEFDHVGQAMNDAGLHRQRSHYGERVEIHPVG